MRGQGFAALEQQAGTWPEGASQSCEGRGAVVQCEGGSVRGTESLTQGSSGDGRKGLGRLLLLTFTREGGRREGIFRFGVDGEGAGEVRELCRKVGNGVGLVGCKEGDTWKTVGRLDVGKLGCGVTAEKEGRLRGDEDWGGKGLKKVEEGCSVDKGENENGPLEDGRIFGKL